MFFVVVTVGLWVLKPEGESQEEREERERAGGCACSFLGY